MFFFISFHLLIALCTQLTQIKEQLQSRSRKLELKGFSLFLPLPLSSFLNTSLQTAQASRVLSEATSAWARPYPLHLSFYFISLRQFSAVCQYWVSLEKLLGSEAQKGLCPSRGLIRSGTLSRWVSKATEKRSTFHPLLVFIMLSTHTIAVYCANL